MRDEGKVELLSTLNFQLQTKINFVKMGNEVVLDELNITFRCSAGESDKTPLLDRRGAETNERSEFVEAGWWNQILKSTTPSPACCRQAHSPAPSVQTHSCHPSWPGGELLKFLIKQQRKKLACKCFRLAKCLWLLSFIISQQVYSRAVNSSGLPDKMNRDNPILATTVSWGFFGHRHINYHAVFLLPPQMIPFYKKQIRYLADHATDPDKRRYAVKGEAPRHYIDMDRYGPAADSLPTHWEEAKAIYGEDSLQTHGIAPWWIMVMKGRLVKAFREGDKDAILQVSADIGHYIGDVHVPLHASSNHNGQKTDQHGIHGFWESRLPELYAEKEYDMIIGKASYLKEPAAFIWQRVRESAAAADTVLKLEKELSASISPDMKFAFELRNGLVMRQYAEQYALAYHQRLQGMVERRMRQAIFAVASFWFTAWVDAGQPNLSIFAALPAIPPFNPSADDTQFQCGSEHSPQTGL
jgi:hypothetical protein